VNTRVLAIALIVGGLVATAVGLGIRQLVADDEGHHDGRPATFALSATSGVHELTVGPAGGELGGLSAVVVVIERAGQPITAFDDVHGAPMHVFAVSSELDWFVHDDPDVSPDGATFPVELPPGRTYRVVTQSAPGGGPDLLELGADVTLDGELAGAGAERPQVIATDDVWAGDGLTVRRQGFDFQLSEPWSGDEYHGGPALLTLFRAGDLAFVHGHASVPEPDRFRFSLELPGRGTYLAALQFHQGSDSDEPVTALFRFEI
jgi:hypothetical protein